MLEHIKKLGVNVNMLTRYKSLAAARAAALTFADVRLVVLGDDGRYWVLSARDAGKLRKAGFETI